MLSKGVAFVGKNAVGLLALFVALGGTTYAAAGGFASAKGRLQGCVARDGTVRLLKAGRHCAKGTPVTWNIEGPRGAIGAGGPAGAPGPGGAKGADGANGVNAAAKIVVRSAPGFGSGGLVAGELQCAAGERAVSGGLVRVGGTSSSSDRISMSMPLNVVGGFAEDGQTPTGWTVRGDDTGLSGAVRIAVVCVSP